jgi:hypothetical protein
MSNKDILGRRIATLTEQLAVSQQENAKLREALESLVRELPTECVCHPAYVNRGKADPDCCLCAWDLKSPLAIARAALAATKPCAYCHKSPCACRAWLSAMGEADEFVEKELGGV